ncbi:MAG: heavy metal-binding domain-containing protein [Phycisphaerales bacterium]
MAGLLQLVVILVLLVVGFTAGRVAERSHRRSLEAREASTRHMLVTGSRLFPGGAQSAAAPCMVVGHACIASDYFKTFLAGLRKIIGGEMRTYEGLCNRARREAMLRMVEQARSLGYDAVCNVRLDGADIGKAGENKGNRGITMVAVMATGTAYRKADGVGQADPHVAPVRIDEA